MQYIEDHHFLRSYGEKIIVCAILIGLSIIFYLSKDANLLNLSVQPIVYLHKYSNIFSPQSRHQFEVVLSYYAENVHHVRRFIEYLREVQKLKKFQPYFIIYNKNSKIDNTYLKLVLKADVVHQLPNLGREGATYLYHIIENYDRLANHIIFCQAGAEGITQTGLEGWLLHRLDKQFNSSVGYMPLTDMHNIYMFKNKSLDIGSTIRLGQLWAVIKQELYPPTGHAIAQRGQFLVSAKRIRARPLRIYKYIYDLITANQTHWIHYVSYSTPDDPIFGHVVERMWTSIFNCTDLDFVDRCLHEKECACYD